MTLGSKLARRLWAPPRGPEDARWCAECRIVTFGRHRRTVLTSRYPSELLLGCRWHVVLDNGDTACGISTAAHCTWRSSHWCVVHGTCSCGPLVGYDGYGAPIFDFDRWTTAEIDDRCPLHGPDSRHAQHPPGYAEGISLHIIDSLLDHLHDL